MKKLLLFSLLLITQLVYAQIRYLSEIPDESIRTFTGHEHRRGSVAFSPDGKYILSGSSANTLNLWDANTGTCVKTFIGHSGSIFSVCFSPDGKKAASGSYDKTIKIWDLNTGACLNTLFGHSSGYINSICYSPDGDMLLSGSEDQTMRLWNPNTGECIKVIKDNTHGINEVAFSIDGQFVFFGSYGNVEQWDISLGQKIRSFYCGHTVTGILFTPDGQQMIATDDMGLVTVWDMYTGKKIKGFERAKDFYSNTQNVISHDGKTLITSTKGMVVDLWNINTEKMIKRFEGHKGYWVYSIALSPDGQQIISGCEDRTIKLWDASLYLSKYTPQIFTLENKIKLYVENKIKAWQTKGEFEKTIDFQNRVNEASRKRKVEELTKLCVDSLKNIEGKKIESKKFVLNQYDPDNEAYLIENTKLGKFPLPVPVADAPGVKSNWSYARVVKPDFYIDNGEFKLSKFSISCNGKTYTYDSKIPSTYAASNITYNFEPIEVVVPQDKVVKAPTTIITGQSVSVGSVDVDVNIPTGATAAPHKYALIIGNEDYSSFQPDLSTEVNVDFAVNDAEVFKKYCTQTLGVPDNQVRLIKNGTTSQIKQGLSWINNLAKIENGGAEIIFYYSGHGLPDDATKDAYLMPVDVSGANVQEGIKLDDVYSKLTEHPAKKTIVLLDACFSGGARNQALVAMKSSKLKPRDNSLKGNMVVLSSSTGEESSGVYRTAKHGYFTYFVLKKLQETKGEITLKELADFVKQKVQKQSTLESRPQTPSVNYSPAANPIWEGWKLK